VTHAKISDCTTSLARLTGVNNNNNELTMSNTTTQYTIIAKLIEDCYDEEDMYKKSPNSIQNKFTTS
jgi:hypothetical protein